VFQVARSVFQLDRFVFQVARSVFQAGRVVLPMVYFLSQVGRFFCLKWIEFFFELVGGVFQVVRFVFHMS
jgi:hypothetical protein